MATIRCAVDSFVSETHPSRNRGGTVNLWLNGAAGGDDQRAFLYFPPPADFVGGRVVSATLSVFARDAWAAGSGTLTVSRVTEKWSEDHVTWDNQPAVDATHAGTLAADSAADGEQLDIDVSSLFQDVADGDPYFGLRIVLSADVGRRLWSSDAADADLRPTLELIWELTPDPPADLEPAGGKAVSLARPVLAWDAPDPSGDLAQSAAQVQVATDADFASVVFDTGWEASEESSYDLAGSTGTVVNYVKNPEAAVGTAEVVAGATQTGGAGGSATISRVTDAALGGEQGHAFEVAYTFPSGGTNTPAGDFFMSSAAAAGTAIPVVPGQTLFAGARTKLQTAPAAGAGVLTLQLYIWWYTAAGAFLAVSLLEEQAAPAVGTVYDLAGSAVAPASAALARVDVRYLGAHPAADGAVFTVRTSRVYAGPAAEYHTGDEDGFDWTGTAHESTTVQGDYPAFAALADGDTRYWRVRVQDAAGVASDWSDGAEFVRQTKGTLTLVSPASSPIYDLSPAVTWTLAGRTQEAYRILLQRLETSGRWKTIWDTGRVTTSDTTYTLPKKDDDGDRLIVTGEQYRLRLRVWDTVDRIGTSGDPTYAEQTFDFTYSRAGGVDPVDTLTATPHATQPKVVLEWTRANEPDAFCIVVDGKEVEAEIDPADLWRSGTTYRYAYWRGHPRVTHTFEVEAVVNGKHSSGNPTADAALNPSGIWLIDPDGDFGVSLDPAADNRVSVQLQGDDEADAAIGALETVHYPAGRRRPVLRTQAIRGYEGTVTGSVASKDERDQLLDLYGRVKRLRLILGDLNLRVRIHDVRATPTPVPGDQKFDVAFSFFQVSGFFDVTGLS